MMDTYSFKCRVGEDGILTLRVPVNITNAEVDVLVVVGVPDQPESPPAQEPEVKPSHRERARRKYEHAYEPWTDEEEQQLMALLKQGLDARNIAPILGRKRSAVESRILKIMARSFGKSHQDASGDSS